MIYDVVPLVLIKHCVTLKAMHAVHRLTSKICVFTEFTDVLSTAPTPGTKLTLIHDDASLI